MESVKCKQDLGFIVLHLGAGYHSKAKLPRYRALCQEACKLGMKLCKLGHKASEIACEVVQYLEDSDLTNAGTGSNLTKDMTIECDAGIMDSLTGNFAAVGCLEGIKNPIRVAFELLKNQEKFQHGLVPPMILAGNGAREFARESGLTSVCSREMITAGSLNGYKRAIMVIEDNSVSKEFHNSGSEEQKTCQGRCRCHEFENKAKVVLGSENSEENDFEPVCGHMNERFKKNLPSSEVSATAIGNNCSAQDDWKSRLKRKFTCNCDRFCNEAFQKDGMCVRNSEVKPRKSFRSDGEEWQMQSSETEGFDSAKKRDPRLCFETRKTISSDMTKAGGARDKMNDPSDEETKLDTVGVICVDKFGNVCSAVSSGGLLLKRPGRIGQAACYGCGCFVAERCSKSERVVAASSVSGCGEQLIKTTLAKERCETLLAEDYGDLLNPSSFLEQGFLKSKYLRQDEAKMAGCINIRLTLRRERKEAEKTEYENFPETNSNVSHEDVSEQQQTKIWTVPESCSLDLMVSCTTKSFYVGAMSSTEKKPSSVLLEMPDPSMVGCNVVSQGFHYRW